jgi:signal transduction histidine kinase
MSDPEKVDALVHLAGTVAHELNNIFTAVTGNLSLLERGFESRDASVISDVIRTANRGIELSQKLQAFAGRQKLNRTRFDINRSVTAVIARLKRSILQNIDIELALLPEICCVTTDEEQLHHVLEELAKNAAAAMDHKGWIIISTSHVILPPGQIGRLPAGSYVKLSLKDSGRGMTPEITRRAMDPLFSTKNGHQGWGLAKCAGFVRQCGGDVRLSSTKGQGAAVELYLPKTA